MSLNRKHAGMIVLLLLGGFLCTMAGCKSPQALKAEADEEVYNILDRKWQEKFGYKANYKIIDGEPNLQTVMKFIPSSGVLKLEDAVMIATRFNRNYQSQKESLYLSALDLTLTRHQYAPQWFGTVDAYWESADGVEQTPLDASGGCGPAVPAGG